MHSGRPVKNGFTLIELSIVLAVLSLMLAGVLSGLSQNTRRAKMADVQARLDTIQVALMDFIRFNNRLPCPADGTLAVNTRYFGIEGVSSGACTTGSTYDANGNRTAAVSPGPTANFTDKVNTVAGVVPVKTLGLPDEAMFDPWGGAFTYAVDMRATGSSAFTTYLPNSPTIGSITVMDGSVYPAYPSGNPRVIASGSPASGGAVMAIISHGPDGHGAYQLNLQSSGTATRKATGATNSDELQNCHCDANVATNAGQPFNSVFVQHDATSSPTDPLNIYDDIVRFYLRSNLITSSQAGYSR